MFGFDYNTYIYDNTGNCAQSTSAQMLLRVSINRMQYIIYYEANSEGQLLIYSIKPRTDTTLFDFIHTRKDDSHTYNEYSPPML